MLQRFPNVILWVNGHSHQNRVWPHPDPSGRNDGFWEDYSRAQLAALSLELAMNDPALDRSLRLGTPEDRNVELVIANPLVR